MTGKNPTPKTSGYYWAKWLKASPDTQKVDDTASSDEWEIVLVDLEGAGLPVGQNHYILVHGASALQRVEDFLWGSKVADLNGGPVSYRCIQCGEEVATGRGTNRRSHARYCSDRCRVAAHRTRLKSAGGSVA